MQQSRRSEGVEALPGRLLEWACRGEAAERFLIVGEGATEVALGQACLRHVGVAEAGSVWAAEGGSPAKVIEAAVTAVADAGKVGTPFALGRRLVLLDADRGPLPMAAQRRVAKFGLQVLWSDPCLEADVLRWLGLRDFRESSAAKAYFEAHVLGAEAKVEAAHWAAVLRARVPGNAGPEPG